MSSDEATSSSIKRRLRSSGEAFAEHTLETAKNAAKGLENTHAAYIYPLQGLYYFLTHPALLKPFFSTVVTSLVLATGIVVATCFFGYLPQAAAMTIFLGPFGFVAAGVVVLLESWFFVKIFVGSFLIKGMIGEEVFEAVLQQRSNGSILGLKPKSLRNLNIADRATKAAQSFRPGAIGQYFLTLPLAFIPFIGWALFVYLNAAKTAKSYVSPYLRRGRGLSTNEQRAQIVDKHEAEFNSFGAVALLLEQVPIIGALFQITNFVGAALWVEKLDAARQLGELNT